jgi:HSP20 family protein
MLSERMTDSDKLGELEEIFEILVTSYSQKGGAVPTEGDLCWRPATDAYETKDTFVVQMDLAGMDPAGIEVLTDGQNLTVRGIRQDIAPPGKKHFIKMEINVGPFIRRVPIPIPVNLKSAVASYRNGFLYVTFKKGRHREQSRRHISVDE